MAPDVAPADTVFAKAWVADVFSLKKRTFALMQRHGGAISDVIRARFFLYAQFLLKGVAHASQLPLGNALRTG